MDDGRSGRRDSTLAEWAGCSPSSGLRGAVTSTTSVPPREPPTLQRVARGGVSARSDLRVLHRVSSDNRAARLGSTEGEGAARPVQIRTLGGFELRVDGEAVHFDRKTPRRTLDLVKCIVALGAAGAGRESLAAALWPDAEGDAARSALEVTLHRLRRLLGRKSAAQLSHGVVRFEDSLVWIDAIEFDTLVDRATGDDGMVGVEAAFRALALYRGPFLLNDEECPWLLPRRARLRSRFVRLAVHTAQHCTQAGDPARAADIYAAALEAEPLVETLYLQQMRCLAQQGRRAEAFDVYRVCRNMLAVAFGAAPSAETEAAHRSIRVG